MFPATRKYAYLNCAATGPMPSASAEAVLSQLRDVSENGSVNVLDWVRTKKRCRELAATMLNVRPEQIAFMRNTSDGFAAAAHGMNWQNGDNIVTFEREFPANFYAWRSVRDKFGVELRICPEREGRYDTDELIAMIDANTKLVTVSAVQFGSGYRADLERIGEAAKAAGALFAVDIIQAFGAMPLDLSGLRVDIAAGASHKWLVAPEGCGMLYLSDEAREKVDPVLVGWISVVEPWDFSDIEQDFKPSALALESGTGPSSLFYGLEQSLMILHETGAASIASYLEGLSDHLCELLAGRDYDIISSRAPGEKSQIVCIKHRNGLTSSDIAAGLEKENVIVSPRGDRLRIAPHFFNNTADIERLVDCLP